MRPFLVFLLLTGFVWGQPVSAKNKYKLARSQAEKGEWKKAVDYCDQALKEAPNYLDAIYLRGLANFGLGNHDKAEKDLKVVVEEDPEFFEAFQQLGNLYLATGRFEDAEAHFQKMLMVPKGGPTARYCLGVVYYAQSDFEKAENNWREAIKMEPSMARAHHNLGVLLMLQDKPRLALASLRTAVNLDDTNLMYMFNLAWALHESKLKSQTLERLRKVMFAAGRTSDGGAFGFAAKALESYVDGDFARARDHATAALNINPKFLQMILLKARLLEKADKKEEALKSYEEVLEIDANVKEAKEAVMRLQKALPPSQPDPAPAPDGSDTKQLPAETKK